VKGGTALAQADCSSTQQVAKCVPVDWLRPFTHRRSASLNA